MVACGSDTVGDRIDSHNDVSWSCKHLGLWHPLTLEHAAVLAFFLYSLTFWFKSHRNSIFSSGRGREEDRKKKGKEERVCLWSGYLFGAGIAEVLLGVLAILHQLQTWRFCTIAGLFGGVYRYTAFGALSKHNKHYLHKWSTKVSSVPNIRCEHNLIQSEANIQP